MKKSLITLIALAVAFVAAVVITAAVVSDGHPYPADWSKVAGTPTSQTK